jgi:Flp pilus assembly protein TadG
MLVATMESAMIYVAQTTLDFGVTVTQRQIRTGAAQRAGRSATEMRTMVCNSMQTMMPVDCTNSLWLDVDSFPSLTGINPASPISNGEIDPGQINYNPGGPDAIVLVRAYYAWKIQTPFLASVLANMSGDRRLVSASRLMRVEPYPVGGRGGAMIGRFWRDRRGAAAVEFALIAPGMVALMFGLIEVNELNIASLRTNYAAAGLADVT